MSGHMKNINEQLEAISVMKAEFLRFFNGQVEQSPAELKARHERIKAALDACGGSVDAYWVAWLFGELEERALDEIRKVVLLAQTTEPSELKEKHFHDLNQKLVDNVEYVHRYLEKKSSRNGNKVKQNAAEAKKKEVVYRANWLLNNPDPDFKGRVEGYRSATLGAYIRETWYERTKRDPSGKGFPVKEKWENQEFTDVPCIDAVKDYLKWGVEQGELPKFLFKRGAPKK